MFGFSKKVTVVELQETVEMIARLHDEIRSELEDVVFRLDTLTDTVEGQDDDDYVLQRDFEYELENVKDQLENQIAEIDDGLRVVQNQANALTERINNDAAKKDLDVRKARAEANHEFARRPDGSIYGVEKA